MNAESTTGRAGRVELSNRRQNALVFYLWILLYMVLALLVRAVALSPLLALYYLSGSPLKYLALLCPLLIVFVVLPLRYSFAKALTQEHGERSFRLGEAFSFRQYGEKLQDSFSHLLSVAKWAIPLLVGGCFLAYELGYIKIGKAAVDVKTMLDALEQLGLWAGNAYAAIANFLTGGSMVIEGAYVEGAVLILLILAILYLFLMYGAVRNSARRYIWALSVREDKVTRVEARRRLAGRRWKQLWVALLNLALLLPPIVLIGYSLKNTVSDFSSQLMMILFGTVDLSGLVGSVQTILIAFFALYLPLLPIRRIFTCRFATRTLIKRKATKPLDEATQAAKAAKGEA